MALFGEKFKSKIEENKVEHFHDLIAKNEQEIGKKKKGNKVF
ncbi:hypothetical protein [Bacillus toyonensis]|nr:hypothetical protein [Bacillus toyonensis]